MDWTKEANWHEHANVFPLMEREELESLAQDIAANGLLEPIKLFEGKVLDGRNRVLACAKVGVKPRFVQWHRNGVSPLAFVVSENLERRHLTTSQRVGLGAKLLPQLQQKGRERQKAAGSRGAEGGRGHKKEKPSAQKRAKGLGKSSQQIAARFGVSARSIEKAAALEKSKRGTLARLIKGKVKLQRAEKEVHCARKLHEDFIAPPFTVLDTRQGYWKARKLAWELEGVTGSHNEQTNDSQLKSDAFADSSAFDPVLAECVYRWFCPPKGRVLDPCAGEAVKGLVAAKLGLDYTGVELRAKQVMENRRRAKKLGLRATWLRGDSAKLSSYVPAKADFDLVFTSPPYFDTEIYSKNKKDSSAFRTFPEFLAWYEGIFTQAVARLKPNRFLVVKVGEGKRNKNGFFHNLVGESISCFLKLGLRYYNTAILATPIGTAAMRVRNQFPHYRKLVGTHQNILCFFKGDKPKLIARDLGRLKEQDYGKQQNEI